MRQVWIILTTVAIATSVVLAQPPTTQPADRDRPGRIGGPSHGDGRHGGRQLEPLSEDQQAELLEALGSRFPKRRQELLQLREDHPDHFQQVTARLWRWYQEWKLLPAEAQETAMLEQELKIQAIQLVRQWREAKDPDEKKALRLKLRDVLTKKFQASQELREKRLAAMQDQIKQLRAENADRTESRDEIIDEQVDQILASPHGRGRGSLRPHSRPRPDRKPDDKSDQPATQPADDES